jgi:hypothetical protein
LTPGPLLFARYAFPPNERGYCGPADHSALRGYGLAGVTDPGLTRLAQAFTGAWPYLQLIAAANRIPDPLEARVVEAYWVGNGLLTGVGITEFGALADHAFRRRVGGGWAAIAATIPAGALPHHSFHVFCVYPWAGLLREGRTEPSLHVLDRCRVGWGQVVSAPDGGTVVVRQRPLTWDGRELGLGPPVPRPAGIGFVKGLLPGDWVSLHWDSVCDRLTTGQLRTLRRLTIRHMRMVRELTRCAVPS